jgi:pimeloyl-ACP methyl ester carboxylesterase
MKFHILRLLLFYTAFGMAQNPDFDIEKLPLTVDNQQFMAYGCVKKTDLPLLIFVHGSPGDYTAWRKYLQDSALRQKYRLIALDRPGYGLSDSTKAYPNLAFQARVVHQIITQYADNQPVVLVGHSLGAPIVTRCAMDYPNAVAHLVLLAPAISAQHEQPRWYNLLVKNKWIRKQIPHEMQTSQDEMMALPAELTAMLPFYKNIKAHISLFHGRLDMIAPFGNSRFLCQQIPPNQLKFTVFNFQNHFIPWTKFDTIRAYLLGLL